MTSAELGTPALVPRLGDPLWGMRPDLPTPGLSKCLLVQPCVMLSNHTENRNGSKAQGTTTNRKLLSKPLGPCELPEV